MSEIKSYRDLIVWEKSMDMVVFAYDLIKKFPKKEEYALSSQLRRCAVSIPSNIAEGFGRSSSKEFCRFLDYARGSLYEFQTQIEIAERLQYIETRSYELMQSNSFEIEKMLNSLLSKLKKK